MLDFFWDSELGVFWGVGRGVGTVVPISIGLHLVVVENEFVGSSFPHETQKRLSVGGVVEYAAPQSGCRPARLASWRVKDGGFTELDVIPVFFAVSPSVLRFAGGLDVGVVDLVLFELDVEVSLVCGGEFSSEIEESVEVLSVLHVSLVPNETVHWLSFELGCEVGKDIFLR